MSFQANASSHFERINVLLQATMFKSSLFKVWLFVISAFAFVFVIAYNCQLHCVDRPVLLNKHIIDLAVLLAMLLTVLMIQFFRPSQENFNKFSRKFIFLFFEGTYHCDCSACRSKFTRTLIGEK
jgi:hypothetical protein